MHMLTFAAFASDLLMNKIYQISLLFMMMSACAYGQMSIDTIQLSSTRIPLRIKETGRSITVITSRDMLAMPATSIDEILQSVAGVEVQSRGGFGTQGDILMRGSTFTQVLILIDGMRMNDPLTGHFNSYIPVTKKEIARIEIMRGAASAMYGADAVGGVINIITKTFVRDSEDNAGVNLAYGTDHLLSAEIGFNRVKNKLILGGGASSFSSPGQTTLPPFANSTDTTSTGPQAYNTYFDLKTVALSASYKLNDKFLFSARTSYDYRDFAARYYYTTSPLDKAEEIVTNFWNRIKLARIGARSSSEFNVAFKRNTDQFVFSPDFPSTNNHTAKLLNFTVNHLYELNDAVTLKGGLQVDRRSIESNDRGGHNDMHYGAYAMGVYQRGAFNGNLNVRADHDESYDLQISPSLNLSYVSPKLVLRGSVGKSIRAADYTERYVSNNLVNLTPGRSLGNPELNSEISWSEELGFDYEFSQQVGLSMTFFSRQSSELIDYVSTSTADIGSVSAIGSLQADASYLFAQNISEITTQGLEIQARIIKDMGKLALRWNLGYTFLNTEGEEEIISIYLSSHAKHLVTSQLFLEAKKFVLSVNGLYKSRASMASGDVMPLADDYSVWHAKLKVAAFERVKLHIELRNVFDKQYYNILGAQMPQRWLMGGVSKNF